MADAAAIALGMAEPAQRALRYHAQPDRRSSCGDMAADIHLVFSGLADFDNGRISLTDLGKAVLAVIEAPLQVPGRCVNHPGRSVRETLDGDALCQECCNAWARAEGIAAAEREQEPGR